MKKYEEYKDTGIKWSLKIPSRWSEIRFKYALPMITTKSVSDVKIGLENIESYSAKYIPSDSVYEGNGIEAKKGDILYGKLRPYLAKVLLAERDYNAVGDFYVFRSNENLCCAKYAKWLMLSDGFTKICAASTYGAKMPRVSSDFINSLYIPLPPLAEQEKIVRYLDNKTSKIDALVAEKLDQIKLLNELKESEIANVITRGLNPDVKMKDSGIPWLDSIPEHWGEERAKYLFNRENRPISDEDDIITCFRDGQVTLRKNRRTTGFTESFKECGYQGIRKGDLVIHQMDAFAGSVGISDSDGKGTPVYIVCTPKRDDVYNPYFALVIREMGLNGYIQSLYRGIRERSSDFKFDVFRQQCLPLPPIEEQIAIVSHIEGKVKKVNSLINELESEIEFLREYKQKLIADCVTGQIKVTE